MEFEWDNNKAITNLQKHGVSFAEAATVFGDRIRIISARKTTRKEQKFYEEEY